MDVKEKKTPKFLMQSQSYIGKFNSSIIGNHKTLIVHIDIRHIVETEHVIL